MNEEEQKRLFGRRLKSARVMRGLSQDELVELLGGSLTKMTISKYEQGRVMPTMPNYIALAGALGLGMDYFTRPFKVELTEVEFRKKSRLSVKAENAVKETVLDQVERYVEIEDTVHAQTSFVNPIGRRLVASYDDAVLAADDVRQAWGIPESGIQNVTELLEARGVKVIEIDAPEDFDGTSALIDGVTPVIVLNQKFNTGQRPSAHAFTTERKRFTALHELGHIMMQFPSGMEQREQERLCHSFASEMLISTRMLRTILGERRTDISIQELKGIQANFGMSAEALMHKAMEAGIIKRYKYESFCFVKNRNERFRRWVESSAFTRAERSQRFQMLVYRAMAEGLVGDEKAASLLGMTVERVRTHKAIV